MRISKYFVWLAAVAGIIAGVLGLVVIIDYARIVGEWQWFIPHFAKDRVLSNMIIDPDMPAVQAVRDFLFIALAGVVLAAILRLNELGRDKEVRQMFTDEFARAHGRYLGFMRSLDEYADLIRYTKMYDRLVSFEGTLRKYSLMRGWFQRRAFSGAIKAADFNNKDMEECVCRVTNTLISTLREVDWESFVNYMKNKEDVLVADMDVLTPEVTKARELVESVQREVEGVMDIMYGSFRRTVEIEKDNKKFCSEKFVIGLGVFAGLVVATMMIFSAVTIGLFLIGLFSLVVIAVSTIMFIGYKAEMEKERTLKTRN